MVLEEVRRSRALLAAMREVEYASSNDSTQTVPGGGGEGSSSPELVVEEGSSSDEGSISRVTWRRLPQRGRHPLSTLTNGGDDNGPHGGIGGRDGRGGFRGGVWCKRWWRRKGAISIDVSGDDIRMGMAFSPNVRTGSPEHLLMSAREAAEAEALAGGGGGDREKGVCSGGTRACARR